MHRDRSCNSPECIGGKKRVASCGGGRLCVGGKSEN